LFIKSQQNCLNCSFNFLTGNTNPGEWWPNMDGEPSLSSTMQLQQPSPRLPEFVHSMVEPDGIFTNVNKGTCIQ
jgi:hypothetical protein